MGYRYPGVAREQSPKAKANVSSLPIISTIPARGRIAPLYGIKAGLLNVLDKQIIIRVQLGVSEPQHAGCNSLGGEDRKLTTSILNDKKTWVI